jgi:hypothetical protein
LATEIGHNDRIEADHREREAPLAIAAFISSIDAGFLPTFSKSRSIHAPSE